MPSHPTCSSQKPAPNRGQAHPASSVSGTFHSPLGPPTGSSPQAWPLSTLCCPLFLLVTSSLQSHLPRVSFMSLLVTLCFYTCTVTKRTSEQRPWSQPHRPTLVNGASSLSPLIHTASHTRGPLSRPAAFSGPVLKWQYFAFPRDECSDFSIESFLTDSHSLYLQLL